MGVERARLLTNNIELDERAAQLAIGVTQAVGDVDRLAAQGAEGRALLAALDESLKALRMEAQAAQERRSRSSWNWLRNRPSSSTSMRPAGRS